MAAGNHGPGGADGPGPHPDEELFDRVADPREFANLARDTRHGEPLKQMRSVMDAGWRAARVKM